MIGDKLGKIAFYFETQFMTLYQKPFLKWAGGKHKLVPFIESFFTKNKRTRLVEPFMGSAALSLAVDFDSYLLNDIN